MNVVELLILLTNYSCSQSMLKLLVECETSTANYVEDLEDIFLEKEIYFKFLCFELCVEARKVFIFLKLNLKLQQFEISNGSLDHLDTGLKKNNNSEQHDYLRILL